MYGMEWYVWHDMSDIPVRTDRTVRHRCCHLWLNLETIIQDWRFTEWVNYLILLDSYPSVPLLGQLSMLIKSCIYKFYKCHVWYLAITLLRYWDTFMPYITIQGHHVWYVVWYGTAVFTTWKNGMVWSDGTLSFYTYLTNILCIFRPL